MSSLTKKFEPLAIDDGEDSFPLAPAPAAATDAGSPNSVNSAAKPFASIPLLADYLVNGFWSYNSTFAHHWGSSTITYNISGLNANEQMLAQSALNAWHEVANLTFVQTSGTANITFTHNGTMTAYETDSYNGSGIISVAFINISADWITNDGGAYDGKTGIDSYGYQTYIHEIGHALGLGHQGPYNGSASYATNAIYADDTWQYSVMSYFAQNNYTGSYRYVVTPQMADIYAVQAIYGAATTRTGDTVYGFHNTAGSIFNFNNYTQAPALTIYDSGGNDTLDCSGYSASQTIDLHAGGFSSVGGLINNIGIALNANIENAIGGSGNDALIANDMGCTLTGGGGNDTLTGGAGIDRLVGGIGVDTMSGGGGADTFFFALGDSSAASGQHDRINGFISGIDRIDLSGIDAIASSGAYDLFRFIGASAFDGGAGALNYFYNSSLGVTVLEGDTNGDRVADFAIDIAGNVAINASSLIGIVTTPLVIETSGSTRLTQIGGSYYLYDNGGSGPSLKYAGATVVTGQFGGFIPIGAEQTASGYVVAWRIPGTDQYTAWSTDSSGNYIANIIGVVSGTSTALESLETTFQQDLNGDSTIGIPTTVIEAFGSTSLTGVGNNFYLYNGGSGPSLKYAGATVVTGQFGGFIPIGAEQTASGYVVAWRIPGTDQYTAWSTDSSGNYIANIIGVVSGTSTALESLETTFQQDLNGDSTIGIPTTVIEAFGSTSLTGVGNNFYLYNGGSGPSLKYAGATVVTGQFGGFIPIGAEQTASGYVVAWRIPGTDQYTAWSTDSSGNYIANIIGVVSGTSTALESLETTFQQDLNGDSTIGIPTTVIEAFGSTSLTGVGNNFYLYNGGSGPSLKYAGATVVTGQFGGFIPIGAEQTASGYVVAWRIPGTDQYTAWSTDSSGNYIANIIGVVSGTSTALESLETTFQQDLNGDSTIGIPTTVIEAFGSTSLTGVGNNFYLYNGGSGPSLKYAGATVVTGQFGGFIPIGAEQTASGYVVAWRIPGTDQYTAWSTDSSGNYIANIIGVVSGTSTALESLETTFQQDLNGDSTIGIPTTVIEAFGSTSLTGVGNNFYLYNGGSGPSLKYAGATVVTGQFGGFIPIGAEQTASGYVVAWRIPGTDQYTAWSTDSSGNYIANIIGVVSGTSTALESLETTFQQDLNGDSTIGIPTLAATVPQTASAGSTAINELLGGLRYGDAFVFNFDKETMANYPLGLDDLQLDHAVVPVALDLGHGNAFMGADASDAHLSYGLEDLSQHHLKDFLIA